MQEEKIDYGVDAPKVIRNLLIIGAMLYLIGVFVIPKIPWAAILFLAGVMVYTGIFMIIEGLLMFWYSKYGKLKHRDRMLRLFDFKGDEQVLDVGTGRGLLLIGAAKKLTTGKATGIDIWNSADLTDNHLENALLNVRLEGVRDRIEILNEDITDSSLKDNFFDLIVSNLCLHNIYDPANRKAACKEIVRLLKPGGTAIISDFKHTATYRAHFTFFGCKTEKIGTYIFSTFPALTIIKVVKEAVLERKP